MPQQAPKPGHQHLHIRDVPLPDVRALRRAAALAEPPTSATQLIRDLIHARVTQAQPGPATGYKFELTITGIDERTADDLLMLLGNHVENAHGEMGGGYHRVDDNGNPVA